MGTIVDYATRQTASFARKPFNTADSIALAQLSYYHLPQASATGEVDESADSSTQLDSTVQSSADGEVNDANDETDSSKPLKPSAPLEIGDLTRIADPNVIINGGTYHEENIALLQALSVNPRFRFIRISNVIEPVRDSDPNRFAACCFDLGDGTLYISFRGTDDTTAAWHEDFEMAFLTPVQSQKLAVEYTRSVMEDWHGSVILGGHSKGGNLAVYAAAQLPRPLQKRIRAVYSHDGPGFEQSFIESAGFQRIRPLVHKTVPEQSVIGGLFESGVESTVVTSSAKGIWQHLTLTWQFDDNAHLLMNGTENPAAQYFSQTINRWMAHCTPAERRAFINDFFTVFGASGYVTFTDIMANWSESFPRMLGSLHSLEPDERKNMTAVLRSLAQIAMEGAVAELPNAMADLSFADLPFMARLAMAPKRTEKRAEKRGKEQSEKRKRKDDKGEDEKNTNK